MVRGEATKGTSCIESEYPPFVHEQTARYAPFFFCGPNRRENAFPGSAGYGWSYTTHTWRLAVDKCTTTTQKPYQDIPAREKNRPVS